MAQVKHVVLLRFNPETTAAQIRDFYEELADLKAVIPGLLDFIGGPYRSPEGLNQGFTDGFIMTFSDPAARDTYLPHPAHERVKSHIVPHVDAIVAFDFEVGG